MVLNSTQRVMERRQIRALIQADKVELSFIRSDRVDDGAGSWRKGPPRELPPQECALIPFKRRMTEFLVNTELGNVPDLPYVLLGFHTLDVKRGDTFTFQGEQYEVQTVDLKREVRVAAHVDYFGGAPNG